MTLHLEICRGSDGGTGPSDGGVLTRCNFGRQPCGLAMDPECPADYYCIAGCCIPTLI